MSCTTKKRLFSLVVGAAAVWSAAHCRAMPVLDFEEALVEGTAIHLTDNSYWDGAAGPETWPTEVGPWDDIIRVGQFQSGEAFFSNRYNVTFKMYEGWAWSNRTDITTVPKLVNKMNQYSAVTGQGHGPNAGASAHYAVAYEGTTSLPTVSFLGDTSVAGVYLTNTFYAWYVMQHGLEQGRKFAGPHGNEPGDFFKVTITGKDAADAETGTVDFYLADFRSSNIAEHYIIQDWTWVGLSSLGANTRSLDFRFTSSDEDPIWGSNTPAYAAVDNLVLNSPPPKIWSANVIDGKEPTGQWNNADNWGGTVPGGSDLVAFDGFSRRTVVNDTPRDSAGITFAAGAGAFTLTGQPLQLAGPVTSYSSSAQRIDLDLVLAQGGGTFDTAKGSITVAGDMSGAQGLAKHGFHTLTLAGTNRYAGGTSVSAGVLEIANAGALPAGSSLTIGAGATVVLAGAASLAMPASAAPAAVPEPGTLAMLAAAGLAVILWKWRRQAA